jgi:hypothetical protein
MGVPMVIWKDGKVVEFLPEPPREPRGNHLAPSVTFFGKKTQARQEMNSNVIIRGTDPFHNYLKKMGAAL